VLCNSNPKFEPIGKVLWCKFIWIRYSNWKVFPLSSGRFLWTEAPHPFLRFRILWLWLKLARVPIWRTDSCWGSRSHRVACYSKPQPILQCCCWRPHTKIPTRPITYTVHPDPRLKARLTLSCAMPSFEDGYNFLYCCQTIRAFTPFIAQCLKWGHVDN
jgi:hypothetical protein